MTTPTAAPVTAAAPIPHNSARKLMEGIEGIMKGEYKKRDRYQTRFRATGFLQSLQTDTILMGAIAEQAAQLWQEVAGYVGPIVELSPAPDSPETLRQALEKVAGLERSLMEELALDTPWADSRDLLASIANRAKSSALSQVIRGLRFIQAEYVPLYEKAAAAKVEPEPSNP